MKYVVIDPAVVAAALARPQGRVGRAGGADGADGEGGADDGQAARSLLRAIASGEVVPLLSTPLAADYESVLAAPEQRLAHGLSAQAITGFLAALMSAAEPVDVSFLWRPQLRDPEHELILEAAVSGSAQAIITARPDRFAATASLFGLAALTPHAFMENPR